MTDDASSLFGNDAKKRASSHANAGEPDWQVSVLSSSQQCLEKKLCIGESCQATTSMSKGDRATMAICELLFICGLANSTAMWNLCFLGGGHLRIPVSGLVYLAGRPANACPRVLRCCLRKLRWNEMEWLSVRCILASLRAMLELFGQSPVCDTRLYFLFFDCYYRQFYSSLFNSLRDSLTDYAPSSFDYRGKKTASMSMLTQRQFDR